MAAAAYIDRVRMLFAENSDPENARPMRRYMREQFPFFGLKAPRRRELGRQLIHEQGMPEGEELKTLCRTGFRAEEREVHYFVCELLVRQRRGLDISFLDLCEELIQTKSWWDTVDILAPRVTGFLLQRFPAVIPRYPDRWVKADNLWLRRSALLYQLSYKENTDTGRLYDYVLRTADSGEFFVEKAAGWALRQYSRVDPDGVASFIAEHPVLPALTQREGLKHLRNAGKKPR